MTAQSGSSVEWPLSRREFLRISAVAGVSLTVAVYLGGCDSGPTPLPTTEPTAPPSPTPPLVPTATPAPTAVPEPTPTATAEPVDLFEPNIYLTVDPSGTVTIRAFRSEMGQGIRTAIAMIVADEMDADWSTVRIVQSPVDRAYGDQVTGGSVSVSNYYAPLRQAGAMARQVLVAAAAQVWGVDPTACRTEKGAVVHPDGQTRLGYGQLIESAMALPLPSGKVVLKDPQDWTLIGTPQLLYDAPAMVDGSALYASDVRLPGMLYAVVARCPVFEGRVASFDDSAARAVAGVRDVIQIDSGLAVVADNTWAAIQGRSALKISWDEGAKAGLSSESILQQLAALVPQSGSAGEGAMDAVYDIPYLAHATMEPMSCVADVRADHCEVWAASQTPQSAKTSVSTVTKLLASAVEVHVPLIGGGFGRRHVNDFVTEAVQVSMAMGAPVKLIWTRDDDLQHDRYHPLSRTYISAELDAAGIPTGRPLPRRYPTTAGAPAGYWRSVENFAEAWAQESFMDEVAAAGKLDPVELRLKFAPERGRAVIQLATDKAGWGNSLPAGWGRGLAHFATFGVTHVAHVVEVSVTPDGQVRVHRVICAVDCGTVINPDTVIAQMEGGIVFGLTAALKPGITLANGRVQQSNFHDNPLLRFDEMPVVEVYIVPSAAQPSGIGEMGVPPIAPAVANAIFAATGKRVRHLPILPQDLV